MTEPFHFPEDGVVDLSNCHREAIQFPGAIQPHGLLVVLAEPELVIRQVTSNVVDLLGRDPEDLIGTPLSAWLDDDSTAAVRSALSRSTPAAVNPLELRLREGEGEGETQAAWDGIVHRTEGVVILELEPALEEFRVSEFYQRVRRAVARLQTADRLLALCEIAVEEIRDVTGFDRVMAYRFDREWNGEVIAESRTDSLPSWVGHRYPAADIPEQARRLYTLNWLRIIPETSYEAARLLPSRSSGVSYPLDLSHSVLRSVSPIHLEYLSNMGVRASMSISLLRGGELWGLIVCHHSSPRYLPYELRTSCEHLAQTLSWQIAARQDQEAADKTTEARVFLTRLMAQLSSQADITKSLGRDEDALLGLVSASGAAICRRGTCQTFGRAPSVSQVEALIEWVSPLASDGWFESERLGSFYEPAKEFRSHASGLLAIRISDPDDSFILWFREEMIETVRWGSPPRKTLTFKAGRPRLTPMGSREAWEEKVRGQSMPWETWEVEAALELRRALLESELLRTAELAKINEQLRRAGSAKDEFLATLSHELRNPLNAIVGWTRLLRSGKLPADRREHAIDVVARNAEIQSQLIDDLLDISRIVNGKLRLSVQPVELATVIDDAIETVQSAADAKSIRIRKTLDRSSGQILGDADRLQQVIWNLLSNAIKFTEKRGSVQVTLGQIDSSLEVQVIDNGRGIEADLLPRIFDRFHQGEEGISHGGGLGLGLSIVRGLVELHGGTVKADSKGPNTGATFTVQLPIASVRRDEESSDSLDFPAVGPEPSVPRVRLDGLRVLVIDDDDDSRELVSEILREHRAEPYSVASPAAALEAIDTRAFDVILSDIGMPDMDGYELLREIRARRRDDERQIPAAALTAYARPQDRARAFRAGFQTHLAKPIDSEEMVTIVASLGGRLG